MPTIADYPPAVRRIMDPDSGESVPEDMTDRNDVFQFLRNREDSRVDANIAANVADAVVTSEDVTELIDNSGQVPTEDVVDAMANVADNYEMDARAEAVGETVSEDVATVESIEAEIADRGATTNAQVREAVESAGDVRGPDGGTPEVVESIPTVESVTAEASPDDGPVFREDIEAAADSIASESPVETDTAEVVQEAAVDAGAPTRSQFRQEGVEALTQNQVEVTSDSFEDYDGAGERVSTVESEGGETIGVVGSGKAADAVAAETGARTLSGGTTGPNAFDVEQGDGSAELQLDGQTVRSFDVE